MDVQKQGKGLDLVLVDQHREDMELAAQARAGDRHAFDELFYRHKQTVYNVCLGILGSQEDAIDATQTTFVQAFKYINSFQGKSSIRTWLYRIATNTALSVIRKQKRQPECVPEMVETADEGKKPCDDRVWEALFELPSDVRAVLVLFYFHDLSGRELAEALGCSEGSTRVRLHRARQAFKEQYEEVNR